MPNDLAVFTNWDSEFICSNMVAKEEGGEQSHAHYALVLTKRAGIRFFANGEDRILHAMTMVLIRPGDTYCFSAESGEGEYAAVCFRETPVEECFSYLYADGKALRRALLEAPMPPIRMLAEREKGRVLDAIGKLEEAKRDKSEHGNMLFRLFLAECIGALAGTADAGEEEKTPFWLKTACERMRAHENFSEGLGRMVEISGKTREHLLRSMKKYKNMTGSEYINGLRLQYVAEKLIQSEERIVDLCYESGFTSLDHFGKQFRKKYGMSPTEYRKAYRNQ